MSPQPQQPTFDFSFDDNQDFQFAYPEKISSVKKRGGGSWVLGFVGAKSHNDTNDFNDTNDVDRSPPGLVRSNSSGSLSSQDSSESDSSSSTTSSRKGVSFNESVTVVAIPHASSYSPMQRRKMYSSTQEVRENKIRNKKEYIYDGCDWRNATEECEMSVCMVTGELIHPAHDDIHYPIFR